MVVVLVTKLVRFTSGTISRHLLLDGKVARRMVDDRKKAKCSIEACLHIRAINNNSS